MGQSCPGRFALGFGGDLERDQQECLWRRERGCSLFAFFYYFRFGSEGEFWYQTPALRVPAELGATGRGWSRSLARARPAELTRQ